MTTGQLAKLLNGILVGSSDVQVVGLADVAEAVEGNLAYADTAERLEGTHASCVLVPITLEAVSQSALIKVADPKLAFAIAAQHLVPSTALSKGVHPTAVIAETAALHSSVSVGPFASIGKNSSIGEGSQIGAGVSIGEDVEIGIDCVLHANVSVLSDCRIGDRVILYPGVVIGADGFGYVRSSDGYVKFPQIGSVVIGDDVEVGANTCIDRGSLGTTTIGNGTKIDNLVQIAHNVQIGERVVIAAQTGISGSTVIEDDCVIGGQVGMGDHARVLAGTVIGSQAGVLPGKIVRPGVWWGTPVQPLDEYKRQNAHVKGLGRLRDDVKELREAVKRLSDGKAD